MGPWGRAEAEMQNPRLNFLPPPLRTKTPPRRDSCRALSHPRCFVRPDQLRPHVFARAKAAERGPAAVPARAALTLGIHPSASSPPRELGWSRRKTIRVEVGKKNRGGKASRCGVGRRMPRRCSGSLGPSWVGRKKNLPGAGTRGRVPVCLESGRVWTGDPPRILSPHHSSLLRYKNNHSRLRHHLQDPESHWINSSRPQNPRLRSQKHRGLDHLLEI